MKRVVRSLIRFIAAGLVLLGITEICLGYLHQRVQKPGWWSIIIGVILLLLGIGLLMISGRLADQLAGDFDE